MVEKIQKQLKTSAVARWTVLLLVSFTMMTGYIVTDVMAPLDTMLNQELGWSASEYGTFTSGYGLFNVFLFMLIFAGMILDKKGPRFTGTLAVMIMIVGASMKYWAISSDFGGAVVSPSIFGWQIFSLKSQVFYAMLGFAVFGMGIEMIGITASKIVVKWFTGRSLALAMGLNVAAGRIGTGIALLGAYPYAKIAGRVSAPLALCLVMLCIGLLAFIVFTVLDTRADKQTGAAKHTAAGENAEEQFKISDIFSIIRIRGFWYLTFLCLLFYSSVFPFLKFATGMMIQKYGFSTDWAGAIPALLPFGNILLTPFFGSIYDKKGKGATIMIIGAVLLTAVHAIFSIPWLTWQWLAVVLMLVLGAAFSLVPSAMWPSVPKIIPYNKLGTAYSLIFWLQNWGLMGVPLLIGYVLNRHSVTGEIVIDGIASPQYDYTLTMLIFTMFGILSIGMAWLMKREDARKQFGLEKPNIESTPKSPNTIILTIFTKSLH